MAQPQIDLKLHDQGGDATRPSLPDGEGAGEPRKSSASTEAKVSFKDNSSAEDFRRRFRDRYRDASGQEIGSPTATSTATDTVARDGVLFCSGNASFRQRPSFSKARPSFANSRTSSRLLDSPLGFDRRSGRSPMSAAGGTTGGDNHDDDDFLDEDVPEEFKKIKFRTATLVQLVSLILIIAALVCNLSIPVMKNISLWDLQLWKWEILLLVIICGHLFSGWGIRIAVFFIERNFLLRKRVLYFVYGLRKPVQNCIWFGLVLIAWTCLFDEKVEKKIHSEVLPYVTRILVCLLVGTLIWLLKSLLVKVLALSFHVNAFFERIQESLFNQYVIETLSMPPIVEPGCFHEEDERTVNELRKAWKSGCNTPADLSASPLLMSGGLEKSPKVGKSPRFSLSTPNKLDEEITIDRLHKLNPDNVSAWNMKRLMNIVRHGTLYTLDERILNSDNDDEASLEIKTERQARKAAKNIFHNVAKLGSEYIYLEDLMCFMREDEAVKTMQIFEGAGDGKRISKTSLKNWMVNAFRERRSLALSLSDTHTAVDELQHFLSIVVGIIIVVVSLLILKVKLNHFLVFFSTQVLLLKFVFGNACKTVFEAIIFLFIIHPFDVGDRCEVEGVQMVVEEMNILTTVFLRYDNQKIIYPNSTLANIAISNYYRSPDMGDAIEFCIHVSTPTEKIAIIRERIKRCIVNNNDHWHPDPIIVMKDVVEMNSVNIAVWPTHRMNHHDMGERWNRRGLLVEEMVKVFKELDINYRLLPLDVNVRQLPNSASSRLPSDWRSSRA